MGFNKYFVPEPNDLVEMLNRVGVRSFFNRKIDAMIGSSASMRILDDAYELVKENIADSEILTIIQTKHAAHLKQSTN
jgi:hypothetical protein